jgi:hypothetical protein
MSQLVMCVDCKEPTEWEEGTRTVYQRYVGWNVKGQSGGSDIHLREPVEPAEFLCFKCFHARKSGVSINLGSLL